MNKGHLFLFITVSLWGVGLVSQQAGMDCMGPLSFTAVRCTLGAITLIPVIIISDRVSDHGSNENAYAGPESLKHKRRELIKASIICGILLLIVTLCQQFGLLYTSVGKGGFITDLYIFLTPLFGLFLGKKVDAKMWFAVIIALVGLYLITMTDGISKINAGDVLMMGAAVSYSVYMHIADRIVKGFDTLKLSCLQFFVMGAGSFLFALIFEPGYITVYSLKSSWIPIVYSGVLSCGVGYTCQLLGQRTVNPTSASLILSFEAAMALLAGHVILGEVLGTIEYIGCAVMMAAIIISVVPFPCVLSGLSKK